MEVLMRCTSRISLRSRALLQGVSHAARSSRNRQCPLHCSEPNIRTGGLGGSGSGSKWRRRRVRIETELPQRCSKTNKLQSGLVLTA